MNIIRHLTFKYGIQYYSTLYRELLNPGLKRFDVFEHNNMHYVLIYVQSSKTFISHDMYLLSVIYEENIG